MLDVIQDTLVDVIKLIPFLFITYLIMEYIEHKTQEKTKQAIKKSGKYGPFIGGVLRNISAMWIFCISYKFICSKSNYIRNLNCSVSFYI